MTAITSRPGADVEMFADASAVAAASSFTVLNQADNLMLFGKPNAIVRPLRHFKEQSNDQQQHDLQTQLLIADIIDRKISKKSSASVDFTKELDAKLRRLQKDTTKKILSTPSSKNGSTSEGLQNRPLFITTVPKGVFLQPTRPTPIVQRRVYAYASRPRVFQNVLQTGDESLVATTSQQLQQQQRQQQQQQFSARTVAGVGSMADGISGVRMARGIREPGMTYQNIMHDRRVVRGSNYRSTHITMWNPYFTHAGLLSGKGDGDNGQKEAEARRRQLIRKRYVAKSQRAVIGTPPPMKNRRHGANQTDNYLEELFDRPADADAVCQTDLFLQRPPTPPFVPAKIGVDIATEILEGELFDFDEEVEPLLEVLVGKSVEQGLLEVMHEEEMATVHEKQQKLLAIREAELSELRRLEEQEVRLQSEKNRRLYQDAISKDLDREQLERATAAKLLQGHIAELMPKVLQTIEPQLDADNRDELERGLGGWLAQQVAEEIGHMIDSRELLEEIVREILVEQAADFQKMKDEEEQYEEDDDDDEDENEDENEDEDGDEDSDEDSDGGDAKGDEDDELDDSSNNNDDNYHNHNDNDDDRHETGFKSSEMYVVGGSTTKL